VAIQQPLASGAEIHDLKNTSWFGIGYRKILRKIGCVSSSMWIQAALAGCKRTKHAVGPRMAMVMKKGTGWGRSYPPAGNLTGQSKSND